MDASTYLDAATKAAATRPLGRRGDCTTTGMRVPLTLRARALPRTTPCPLDEAAPLDRRGFLSATVFFQMLPATALAPAIRPLFAEHHGGREGPMHAFMALNMVGAIVLTLLLASWPRFRKTAAARAPLFALADALLLLCFALPIPTQWLLAARVLEGALHVGLTVLLMSHAAEVARARQTPSLTTAAGTAVIFAVAAGNLVGGLLVALDARAPFWAGAALLMLVAATLSGQRLAVRAAPAAAARAALPRASFPLAAAFLSRFAVGCLIVSFSLFAHRVHGLSDRHVGLLYACLTVPFAFAMFPAGALLRHRPSRGALALGMLAFAGSVACLGHVPAALLPLPMIAGGVASALVFASVLAFAADETEAPARARSMAMVNAAGCFGMLAGPMAGGIVAAIFRDPSDAGRGYRAAFLLAALALSSWVAVSLRWVAARSAAPRGPRPAAVAALSRRQ